MPPSYFASPSAEKTAAQNEPPPPDISATRPVQEIEHVDYSRVVDYSHPILMSKQHIDHVAADKSGATGDDRDLRCRGHFAPIFFMVRTL